MKDAFARLSRKIRRQLKFGAFAGFVSASIGCFPMSIPDHFATNQLLTSGTVRGEALLLSAGPDSPSGAAVVGHQFVLGILPVTRLFFPLGADSFIVESWIDTLLAGGTTVLVTDPAGQPEVAAAIQPRASVELVTSDIAINAYDLVFLRWARVSASVQATVRCRSLGGLSVPVTIRDSEFRKLAFSPALGELFRSVSGSAVNEQIRPVLSQCPAGYRYPQVKADSAPSVVLVLVPKVGTEVDRALRLALAESYGYRSEVLFARGAPGRVVQQALRKELSANGLASAEVLPLSSYSEARRVFGNKQAVLLQTSIERLELSREEDGKVEAEGTFVFSLTSTSPGPVLLAGRCETHGLAQSSDQPVAGRVMSDAASAAVSLFLKGESQSGRGDGTEPSFFSRCQPLDAR